MRSISALALAAALLPAPVLADLPTTRAARDVTQAIDCATSGTLQATQPWFRELDPLARPFAHGGELTFCAGVALQDVVSGALVRRWPVHAKETLAGVQLGAHALAIGYTWRTRW